MGKGNSAGLETTAKRFFLALGRFFVFSRRFYRPNYINHVLMITATIHFTACSYVTVEVVGSETSRTPQK
jgi:hypothetical protein